MIRHEYTSGVKASKIKSTTEPKEWTSKAGNTSWIVEITFENGDFVKLFENSLKDVLSYSIGQKYLYQLNVVTTVYDDENTKTSTKFAFIKPCLPDKVESRMYRVKEMHEYIKLSSELAVKSLGEKWDPSIYKDRYKVIYDTMKTTLFNEDFGELEGEDFDTFLKNNEKMFE